MACGSTHGRRNWFGFSQCRSWRAPVPGFYSRPGLIDPPYVYGILEDRQREDSAAFWCRSTDAPDRFKLIAWVNDPQHACAGVMWETHNEPGGLSLLPTPGTELTGYSSTDFQRQLEPPALSSLVLHSIYDGFGDSFLCHDGSWWIKQWD